MDIVALVHISDVDFGDVMAVCTVLPSEGGFNIAVNVGLGVDG